ncbi:glycosyltransferase family 1 protein [Nostoc sp. UHCC 0302]|uniref:glycosyltransferase family 1 protein n=1 Tax=Nostoc sp. UHCC 0302 TaxID=3134896 RepID=UPI00311CD604
MANGNQHPIRILHVVGGMNRGGIETWLMHVLRHIDRDRFQMDFLVHTDKPCAYDDEIRALGSRIIPCLQPSKPWLYARNFQRILHEYGLYDIVHSHVHHFSGYILLLANQAGVSIRIAHSHLDSSSLEAKAIWKRSLYLAVMKRWINLYATTGLACSRKATSLFGLPWEKDPRWQLLYCGIDLKAFQTVLDPMSVRAEFGIPEDAFVIGHVGRFEQQKNHHFLLEIITEVVKRESNIRLLLVGDGSLHPDIEQKVLQMGLTDYVIFAGSRHDVPRLMRGAMNVFLFPSLFEGLGLVLIEAQAAGLPCILSDVIPEEVDVIKPLMHRLSISQPASIWAEVILKSKNNQLKITPTETLKLVDESVLNIQASTKKLENIYLLESSKLVNK